MPKPTTKLTWCKARFGEDMNWWVQEISDPVHWDIDGLGIIDPRQFQHIIDLIEPLQDYGLQNEILDDAFYSFSIDKVEKDKSVLLKRHEDSILESEEQLFALPDVLDEEKGPYADLLDHLTKLRIKMLNDLIDFSQSLTVEELEEDIREQQSADFLEGRATHFFTELTAILEYVPEGFQLEEEDEDSEPTSEDDELEKDLSDIETEEPDEKIEEDDTMKWDEGEEEEEEYEETTAPPEEQEENEKKK